MSKQGKQGKQQKGAMEPEVLPALGEKTDYSHLPVNEQAAFKCKDKIEAAVKNASSAFYDMSLSLTEAYENDYAKIWGYENFSTYVESQLGMKYRSAYYMVEIGQSVRAFGISREQVDRIGWSKMREITESLKKNPQDASRYLEMAENLSHRQLTEELRGEARMTEERKAAPNVLRLSMKLEGDAANLVNDAMVLAYGDIGKEDVSLAMQHIAGEWLVARGATPQAASLEDWIAYLRKVYGVNLVRAEASDDIDALLSGTAGADDEEEALEKLLASTESELQMLMN